MVITYLWVIDYPLLINVTDFENPTHFAFEDSFSMRKHANSFPHTLVKETKGIWENPRNEKAASKSIEAAFYFLFQKKISPL